MDVLNRIQRRFIWVVLLAVVGLAAGVAYSYNAGSGYYNATARLFVGTNAHDAVEAAQGDLAGQQRVKTYQVLANGADLLERAADRSNTGISGDQLGKRSTFVTFPGTVLLAIRVKADNPNTAASQADAIAAEVTDLVKRVETPIDGGDPALSLTTVQSARSGVAAAEKFDFKKVVLGGLIGTFLGLLFVGALPDRANGAHRQRRTDNADQRDIELIQEQEYARENENNEPSSIRPEPVPTANDR
jgi:polysaccharide biosynthesis transport protein